MLDEVTGPAVGAATRAGAEQLDWPVLAPNQVADPSPRHTSQHVPSDERAARVTVPVTDPDAPRLGAAAEPAAAPSALLMAEPEDPPAAGTPASEGLPPFVTAMLTAAAPVVGPTT
jgi:hypothetical protein